MNAVFLEEELSWNKESRLSMCSVTIHNYTARARAYTILAKWPEREDTSMEFNPRGGKKRGEGPLGLEAGHIGSRPQRF